MRRASLCFALLASACFDPASGGGETDVAATETGGTTQGTTPTSGMTSPTASSDPTTETTPTSSATSMTTDEPTTGPTEGSSTSDIVCRDPEIACGGECVDPATDVAHCGGCDHDCLGGECVEGVCGAVEIATGKGRLMMVELVDDDIYYGGDGVDVGRIGKDGSNDEVIAPAGAMTEQREYCYESTNTGDEVLWGNDWVTAHWAVRGCATPGCAGGVTQYIPGTANIGALLYVASVDRLFWDQNTEIRWMAWPGGADNAFVQMQTTVIGIGHDDEYLYWFDFQGANDIDLRKQLLDGTGGASSMALNRGDVAFGWIAASDSALYWGERGDIVSAPKPNGVGADPPDVVGSVGGSVRTLLVDDTHVYWTAAGIGTGSVQRCPLAGCGDAPEILATPVDRPWGIAQDDVAVYWVTEAGSIHKIAK